MGDSFRLFPGGLVSGKLLSKSLVLLSGGVTLGTYQIGHSPTPTV